jgi:nicotinic acid mononucleotide adenylyltransferase
MKKAITYGRFNILHKGHEKLFLDALKNHDILYLGVSSNDKNVPLEVRMEALYALLAPYVDAGRVVLFSSPSMFTAMEEHGEGGTLILGTEYEKRAKDLAERFHGSYAQACRVTSSTACRGLLDAGKDVSKLIPKRVLRYAKVARALELHGG